MASTLSTTCDNGASSGFTSGVAFHSLIHELGNALHEVATDSRMHCTVRVLLLRALLAADDDRDNHVETIHHLAVDYRNAKLDWKPWQPLPAGDRLDAAIAVAVKAAVLGTAKIVDAFTAAQPEGEPS